MYWNLRLSVFFFLSFINLNRQDNNVSEELMVHYKAQTCDEILPLSKDVIDQNPNNALFWFYKGLCETQVESFDVAKQSLLKAKQLHIEQTKKVSIESLYYFLAICELNLNNTDASVVYIEKALQRKKIPSVLFEGTNFSALSNNSKYIEVIEKYKPSLNTWTTVFLFMVFQGILLFSILIIRKKGNKSSNIILGLFVLSFALTLVMFVLYWSKYIFVSPFVYLDKLYIALGYLFGPLLLLYFQSLFAKDLKFKKVFYHFIPFGICILMYLTYQFLEFSNTAIEPLQNLMFYPWTRIVQMTIYFIAIVLFVKKEKFNVANNVSRWLHYLMYSFFGLILSYVAYFTLVNFSFFNIEWDYMISFVISFFIILISIMGYLQPEIFWGFRLQETLKFVKYKKSGLSKNLSLELKQKLLKLMIDDQVYKENNISLEMLSNKLGTTKHNTSQIINEHFKENFFEFLNDFRIDEAKELLISDSNQLNITEILYEVGFNNKVSFNNAFKKRTGLTPTQFKNRMLSTG